MTRRQQKRLKLLFAYFLWLLDFTVWSNGWFPSEMHEIGGAWLLIYLIGLLAVAVFS
jgi:hypothetical protein